MSESGCVFGGMCVSLPVSVFLRRAGRVRVCACACLCACELTNLKLPWISLWHWLPLATLCLCCVCRLQGLLILECFFFQLQSLTDLACSKGLSHLKMSLLLSLLPFFHTHTHTHNVYIAASTTTLEFDIRLHTKP